MTYRLVLVAFGVAIALGFAHDTRAKSAPHVESARVFFVGWDVLTRARLTPDRVKAMNRISIEIHDDSLARRFADWLDLGAMKPRGTDEPADPRLVLELVYSDGSIETFYADRGYLYSHDWRTMRPIDQSFRERFEIVR